MKEHVVHHQDGDGHNMETETGLRTEALDGDVEYVTRRYDLSTLMLQERAEQVCTAAQLLACKVGRGRSVRHKGHVRGAGENVWEAKGADVGCDVEIAHLRVGRRRE